MDQVGLPASIEIYALLYRSECLFKKYFPDFLSKDMLFVLKRDNSFKSTNKFFSYFFR